MNKKIIIVYLKSNLRINFRQGSNHRSGGLTQLTQTFFFKKYNQNSLVLTNFFKNINKFLTRILSRVDLSFLLGQIKLIIPLFFLNSDQSMFQVNPPGQSWFYITKVIIILLISTLNIIYSNNKLIFNYFLKHVSLIIIHIKSKIIFLYFILLYPS
jgi:hypothetical protein